MKKLLTVALSVALLLSITACGATSDYDELLKENEDLKAQLAELNQKATEVPTVSSSGKTSEQLPPTPIANADENSYTLTAGDYEIPNDIPSGKYDVVAVSGEGEFILDGDDSFIDEAMNSNPEENSGVIKERKNASLKDGDTITINYGLKVQLIPKQ